MVLGDDFEWKILDPRRDIYGDWTSNVHDMQAPEGLASTWQDMQAPEGLAATLQIALRRQEHWCLLMGANACTNAIVASSSWLGDSPFHLAHPLVKLIIFDFFLKKMVI